MLPLQENKSDLILDVMAVHHHSDKDSAASEPSRELIPTTKADRQVHFLNSTQVTLNDAFSASWLQLRSDFMEMPFDSIRTCEDASFRAYDKSRLVKMRMTLDWLDFSVEHMSKWFKILQWENPDEPIPYQKITHQFTKYIENAANQSRTMQERPIFDQAIAVIAFQAYENANEPAKGHDLTMKSLAATIESLRRASFGRVTVSILDEADFDIVQHAFQFLLQLLEPSRVHDPNKTVTQIGHMEVGIAVVSSNYTRSPYVATNMPRATLMGLRDAFLYSEQQETERSRAMTMNMTAWLGSRVDWKYVYLTEPDTILQARPSALKSLKAEVDQGSVLLPHRLQPIPHETDVKGMARDDRYVAEIEVSEILSLDPNNGDDACCDEQAGPDFKPGKPPYYEECGNFWYLCGFYEKIKENRHRRLLPYKFIRLRSGTEIVSLAGTENGRRCIPQTNATCQALS